jgi:hypothetical protein
MTQATVRNWMALDSQETGLKYRFLQNIMLRGNGRKLPKAALQCRSNDDLQLAQRSDRNCINPTTSTRFEYR